VKRLSIQLPKDLAQPLTLSGRVAAKVMLDLTLYLQGPSVQELDFLVDWFARMAPAGRIAKYKIAEHPYWVPLSKPVLTASGRAAAQAGRSLPYLEPARNRVREGRAFEVGFWDGRSIDDVDGSWSFNCTRVHLRSRGLFSFVRILVPLQTDPAVLMRAACILADNVEFISGHGGLVFTYDPRLKIDAMDHIYARARRFWGIDVEDLNVTLPLTRQAIKGVGWLTLLGKQFVTPALAERLQGLSDVVCQQHRQGFVCIAGTEPTPCDRHRPDSGVDPLFTLARALAPMYLDAHPDFTGERFIQHGNTLGWIRRFIEPGGWT
jgi:hypothetical protein